MAGWPSVPKPSLSNLKCAKCDRYLTVTPITSDPTGHVCGRCSPNQGAIKNTIYEEVCRSLWFPCINDEHGCRDKFRFGKTIEAHEKVCIYKQVLCGQWFDVNCGWKGRISDVIRHVEQEHSLNSCQKSVRVFVDLEENFNQCTVFSGKKLKYIVHVGYVKNKNLSVNVILPNKDREICAYKIGSKSKKNVLHGTLNIDSNFTRDKNFIDYQDIQSVLGHETKMYVDVIVV